MWIMGRLLFLSHDVLHTLRKTCLENGQLLIPHCADGTSRYSKDGMVRCLRMG